MGPNQTLGPATRLTEAASATARAVAAQACGRESRVAQAISASSHRSPAQCLEREFLGGKETDSIPAE